VLCTAIRTQDPKLAGDFPKSVIQMDDWLLFFRVDGIEWLQQPEGVIATAWMVHHAALNTPDVRSVLSDFILPSHYIFSSQSGLSIS
jgi:hypothetical protein